MPPCTQLVDDSSHVYTVRSYTAHSLITLTQPFSIQVHGKTCNRRHYIKTTFTTQLPHSLYINGSGNDTNRFAHWTEIAGRSTQIVLIKCPLPAYRRSKSKQNEMAIPIIEHTIHLQEMTSQLYTWAMLFSYNLTMSANALLYDSVSLVLLGTFFFSPLKKKSFA